jgi:hypothetical protein
MCATTAPPLTFAAGDALAFDLGTALPATCVTQVAMWKC